MIIAIELRFKTPCGVSVIILILPLRASLITHKGYIHHPSVSFPSSAVGAVKLQLQGTEGLWRPLL